MQEIESFVYQKLMAQRHIAKGILDIGLSRHELGYELICHGQRNNWKGRIPINELIIHSIDSLKAKGLIMQYNDIDESSKWFALLPSEIANKKLHSNE